MYTGRTSYYNIPFMRNGDTLEELSEREVAQIIENQLRAGILAEGETRVYKEGRFLLSTVRGGFEVKLIGTPAVRGIARGGLVEVFGDVTWSPVPLGSLWYLYIKATAKTYLDPANIEMVMDKIPRSTPDHLYMALLDTRDPNNPVLETQPEGKPTGSNLFELLNNPTNPFGDRLVQSNITARVRMDIELDETGTVLIKRSTTPNTAPAVLIDNKGTGPDIQGKMDLTLADMRVKVALSDTADNLPLGARSLVGAIRRAAYSGPVKVGYTPEIKVDASQGNVFDVLLTGDAVIETPDNGSDGQVCTWRLRQDGIGNRGLRLGPRFRFPNEYTDLSFSRKPSNLDIVQAMYHVGDDRWDVTNVKLGYI